MTKLTLSVEQDIVEQAKRLAEQSNTSVSAMFSRFVQGMAHQSRRKAKIGPLTKKATGIVSLGKDDYKDMLTDALMDKYRK
jgi:hypothetical protein